MLVMGLLIDNQLEELLPSTLYRCQKVTVGELYLFEALGVFRVCVISTSSCFCEFKVRLQMIGLPIYKSP